MNETQEAIERARRHLRNAARESLEASRALIDAALRAGGLNESGPGGLAEGVQSTLDDWIEILESERPFRMPQSIAGPLHRALQHEIRRWEERSIEDETARPVLRAFIGLRELLWELGMREDSAHSPSPSEARDPADPADGPAKSSRPRVQRFDLED